MKKTSSTSKDGSKQFIIRNPESLNSILAKMSWRVQIDYNQFMKLFVTKVFGVSYKKGATLITCQQYPGLVPSVTMLSTYRYIRIPCCFTRFWNDSYSIILISICKVAQVAPLQSTYI